MRILLSACRRARASFCLKPAGSSVPPVARMVLESLGTSVEAFRKEGRLIQVDAAQTTSMLRDGRADLYFESATKGHPAVTEVTLTIDMRFVDLPQKALDLLAKNGVKPSPMPVVLPVTMMTLS